LYSQNDEANLINFYMYFVQFLNCYSNYGASISGIRIGKIINHEGIFRDDKIFNMTLLSIRSFLRRPNNLEHYISEDLITYLTSIKIE